MYETTPETYITSYNTVVGHLYIHDIVESYPHAEIDGRPTTMIAVRLGVTRCRQDDQSERKEREGEGKDGRKKW